MKSSLPILFILLISSCANWSKNFVKEGSLSFRGGIYQETRWSDHLTFKRTSWFQEMTLIYEVMLSDFSLSSPFSAWLSDSERRQIDDCASFKLALLYASDSGKASNAEFFSQMKAQGYERLQIQEFASHLRMHPDYERLALHLYRPYGLCRSHGVPPLQGRLRVNFPGFREVKLK
jgi:hypothetical protein